MRWGTSERIPVRWTPSTAVLICHYGICYYRWTPLYTTPGVILTHLKQNKCVQIVTAWHEKIMICLLFVCIGFRIFRLKTSVMQWYTHCLHPHTSRWVCRCLGLVSIWPGHATCWTNSRVAIDPSHKSHNALEKYSMMHHFVTEMCTRAHFCCKMLHFGIRVSSIVPLLRQSYPLILFVRIVCTFVHKEGDFDSQSFFSLL